MKPTSLVLAAILCLPSAHADALSGAEREAILEKLEQILSQANSKVDARYGLAISAYQAAASSDQAAIDLYLDCVEKINYKDQKKKTSDFREWKRREADKLTDPKMRMALRLQLRWLILTLQAASEKVSRQQLASDAQEIVDLVASEAEKLKGQNSILDQSALSSPYAKAYEIGHVKVENWVFSPGKIGEIYEKIVMPPLRKARNTESLRASWIRRINQEIHIKESTLGKMEPSGEKRRIGMANHITSPDFDAFMEDGVPKLQWSMEKDLFRHGDERQSALRMLGHLDKYAGHKSTAEWTADFIQLLTRQDQPTPPAQ